MWTMRVFNNNSMVYTYKVVYTIEISKTMKANT